MKQYGAEYTYMKRENRDAKARELRAEGREVKKSSMRNQNMHPMYVIDYPDRAVANDTGFGNTVYQTLFGVIYMVAEVLD